MPSARGAAQPRPQDGPAPRQRHQPPTPEIAIDDARHGSSGGSSRPRRRQLALEREGIERPRLGAVQRAGQTLTVDAVPGGLARASGSPRCAFRRCADVVPCLAPERRLPRLQVEQEPCTRVAAAATKPGLRSQRLSSASSSAAPLRSPGSWWRGGSGARRGRGRRARSAASQPGPRDVMPARGTTDSQTGSRGLAWEGAGAVALAARAARCCRPSARHAAVQAALRAASWEKIAQVEPAEAARSWLPIRHTPPATRVQQRFGVARSQRGRPAPDRRWRSASSPSTASKGMEVPVNCGSNGGAHGRRTLAKGLALAAAAVAVARRSCSGVRRPRPRASRPGCRR